MKNKEEKFKKFLIYLNVTDYFLKIRENKFLLIQLKIILINLKLTNRIYKWLKNIDSKCYNR